MASARKPAARLARNDRIEVILNTARDVFCEKGYEQTVVSEIAARIGVVEGTIYKYFDSKRDLLLKVLEHWYEEMFGDYSRDLAAVQGSRARLRMLVWRHLRSVRDYPQLCRLMFREVRSGANYRDSNIYAMNQRYTRFLTQLLQDAVDAGELRSGLDLNLLRDMVYGGIEHHAWAYMNAGKHKALDIDAIADQITAALWNGVAVNKRSKHAS